MGSYIVCTPLFCWGVEPPTKFSKRWDSTGSRFLEEVAGNEVGDLFQGTVVFT